MTEDACANLQFQYVAIALGSGHVAQVSRWCLPAHGYRLVEDSGGFPPRLKAPAFRAIWRNFRESAHSATNLDVAVLMTPLHGASSTVETFRGRGHAQEHDSLVAVTFDIGSPARGDARTVVYFRKHDG